MTAAITKGAAGLAGDDFATDKIATTHYPKTKLIWGDDGVVNPVNAANPLPVAVIGTVVIGDGSGPVTVDGAVSVSNTVAVSGTVALDAPSLAALESITIGTALPAGAAIIGALVANQSTNIAQVAGTAASVNAGNADAGTQRVVQSANGPTFVVDNAAFTDGSTIAQIAGFIFDETAGTALTENDAGAARMDSKRALVNVLEDATTRGRRQTVNVEGASLVTPTPSAASSGMSAYRLTTTASINANAIKASAGNLYKLVYENAETAIHYLKLWNKASAPAPATDSATLILAQHVIYPGDRLNLDYPLGKAFSAGIAYTITTASTDTSVAATSGASMINAEYK